MASKQISNENADFFGLKPKDCEIVGLCGLKGCEGGSEGDAG